MSKNPPYLLRFANNSLGTKYSKLATSPVFAIYENVKGTFIRANSATLNVVASDCKVWLPDKYIIVVVGPRTPSSTSIAAACFLSLDSNDIYPTKKLCIKKS